MNIETVVSHGNTYRVANGTFYNAETSDAVIRTLERLRHSGTRVRLFYGQQVSDSDAGPTIWDEENDVCGTVGRSSGQVKIPLLIPNVNSFGGGGILDSSIVAIKTNRDSFAWKAPGFDASRYVAKEAPLHVVSEYGGEYEASVFNPQGDLVANFKTMKQAQRYAAFMRGERMGR